MTYEVKKVVKQDISDYVLRRGDRVSYSFSDADLSLSDHHR